MFLIYSTDTYADTVCGLKRGALNISLLRYSMLFFVQRWAWRHIVDPARARAWPWALAGGRRGGAAGRVYKLL